MMKPDTYEDFTWRCFTFKMLSKKFDRVDIVADTYREKSIKSGEITKRGSSSKVIIGSCKSKVPRDFANFLKNGENKTRLIEIISEVIVDNRVKAIKLLQTEVIYISRYQETICITERYKNKKRLTQK